MRVRAEKSMGWCGELIPVLPQMGTRSTRLCHLANCPLLGFYGAMAGLGYGDNQTRWGVSPLTKKFDTPPANFFYPKKYAKKGQDCAPVNYTLSAATIMPCCTNWIVGDYISVGRFPSFDIFKGGNDVFDLIKNIQRQIFFVENILPPLERIVRQTVGVQLGKDGSG